ncbi:MULTISPECIES: helix-turn-helix transcriptional regulator [Methylobacteriaceae]|uniref:DNA-binding transcriptional ArsR family regulator n=1 Tax=Methylorubrum thiocyanatum TaxID=47958 RepID=A0AA40VCI6_9HYPH|nr:metalloregulator ArsR/SmtB family transcription factor [Methylorubrum thiocyanatum]AWI88401.1 transcriptional regulator [Methylobacterium sp. DM1]MBA8914997.1 DNA-binding transcriptional ArsR family regulator [Methylorubrum thiocyanatum]GJE79404.1 Transcriptional activator HlyU [Methylorubrum thiocyanatum]
MPLQAETVTTGPEQGALDLDLLLANARDASELLKALAHEARLVILCLLVEGERSVSELEQLLNLRQPAVSQQLARLRADDLVEARRDGKNIYYALARPEVREIIAALHRAFCDARSR